MNVHFVNVETTALRNDEVKKLWNIHDYKSIIAFRDINAFMKFQEIVKHVAQVNMLLKPKTIGKGYYLYYKMYNKDNIRELRKDIGDFHYNIDGLKEHIKEYLDKNYFFIFFTQQDFCYDPMFPVIEDIFDYMELDEHSYEIEDDDIHWVLNGKWGVEMIDFFFLKNRERQEELQPMDRSNYLDPIYEKKW